MATYLVGAGGARLILGQVARLQVGQTSGGGEIPTAATPLGADAVDAVVGQPRPEPVVFDICQATEGSVMRGGGP